MRLILALLEIYVTSDHGGADCFSSNVDMAPYLLFPCIVSTLIE